MIKELILPIIAVAAVAISIALFAVAAHDTDQRMQAEEKACAAKGGVLIDTSEGYKCYGEAL